MDPARRSALVCALLLTLPALVPATAPASPPPVEHGWGPEAARSASEDCPDPADERVRTAENGDGTTWELTYWTCFYDDAAEADAYAAAYADAAVHVHDAQVVDWGFASDDRDGVLEIEMSGGASAKPGDDCKIFLAPKLEEYLAAFPGVEYPSRTAIYRSVIGHELHHCLQVFEAGELTLTGAVSEGGARFVETLLVPKASHQPGSGTYALPGHGSLPGMMTHPNASIGERVYDFGLFFGHLYRHDGGLEMLKRTYRQTGNVSGPADERVPEVVDRVLANVSGAHAGFDDAYGSFAVAMLDRAFPWAAPGDRVREWGRYLPAVEKIRFEEAAGVHAVDGEVAENGLVFVEADVGGPATATFVAEPGIDGLWTWQGDDGRTVRPADTVVEVPADARDVHLVVIGARDELAGSNPGDLLPPVPDYTALLEPNEGLLGPTTPRVGP